MKQFLKSTAIFACIALLFCACSDDGTEDLEVSSSLEVTGLTNILPGNSRVWVKWIVPEDDAISTCNVSWSNDSGTAAGTAQFNKTTGWMEHIMDNVPSGNYTFEFQNFNSKGIGSNILTKEVYIYDEATYSTYPTISSMYADDSGITINWDEAPADCLGVKITYTKTNGVTTTTFLTSIDEPTLLSEAEVNTTFKFASFFCPDNGLDEIELANDDSQVYQFPDTAPAIPSEVVVNPGDERFKVYWYVPQISEITSTVVVYAKGDAVADTVRVTSMSDGPLVKGGNNELVISKSIIGDAISENESGTSVEVVNSKLSAGEYTVTLYNEKGLTGTVSDSITTTVTVYDGDTYTIDPLWIGYGEENPEGLLYTGENATIEWQSDSDIVDCVGAKAFFTDAQGNSQESSLTMLTSLLTMLNVAYPYSGDDDTLDESSTFTYSTYYCPENGLDTMVVAHGINEYIPLRSSSTPINVEIRPGNNLIYITFDLESDDTIAEVDITYSDGVNTYEEIILAKNLNIGSENVYTLSGDNVSAGTTYSAAIRTRNEEGRSSGVVTAENLLVYDFATFEANAIPPAIAEYVFDSYTNALTITWDTTTEISDATMEFTYVYNPYGNVTKTIEITDFSSPLVLTDAMPGNEYSYVVTFVPAENAMDDIPFPEVSGEFDDIEMTYTNNYMWFEYADGYNDDNATDPLFVSYSETRTNRGYLYYPNFGTWTPSYNYEETTEEAIASTVFPGDYIPCDNQGATSYWRAYKLIDESYNLRYATGTATYEWTTHTYYDESNTNGVYKLQYKANGGITIDLSHASETKYAYKLSEINVRLFANSSADGAYWNCNNVKTFSLYGTNDPDPASNSLLTATNEDGTPDMTYWELLLDNAQIARPTEAYYDPTSPYYLDLEYLDANGDGIIDSTDDWDSVNQTCKFSTGWTFPISKECNPVRFVRMILHTNSYESDTPGFLMNEISFSNRGYTEETRAAR